MKKTVSVNIKGLNFMIEDDAYELLHQYITRLEKNLHGQKGSKDIVEDIELRIAELCQQFLSEKKEVIEKTDIESIIATLGEPEDYIDENFEQSAHDSAFQEEVSTKEKRLYRDIENAKIAGICAGFANYLNVDVIIIRVIFLLFLFVGGFGFPLYLILWFAIPKANSTIDRLKMRGKAITVDSVKEEIENAAKRFSSSSKSFAEKIKKDQNYTRRFSRIGKFITSIFGIGLLVTGVFFLIIFTILFFGGLRFIPIVSEQGFLSVNQLGELLLSDVNDILFVWLGVFLVSFSVILFLISNGSFVLLKIKSKWTKISSLSLVSFGIIGTVICIFLGMKTARDVIVEAEIEKEIASISSSELSIEVLNEKRPELGDFKTKNSSNFDRENVITLKGNTLQNSGIKLIYRHSKDSLFHVFQSFSANSYSYENALLKAHNIKHQLTLDSSILYINPEFSFPKKDKIRNQRVFIIIEIPTNKSVRIGEEKINLEYLYEQEIEKSGYLEKNGEYENWD